MSLTIPATTTDGTCRHFQTLAEALHRETAALCAVGLLPDRLVSEVQGSSMAIQRSDAGDEAVELYRRQRNEVAAALDGSYQLAASYASMEEFWADASAQEQGQSWTAYWDSYENGLRRRLEQELATAYGSDQAVLVNSGMSAIDVALRSVGLMPGSTLLTHHNGYFETDEYLTHLLVPNGVHVLRADLTDPTAINRALAERPTAALVEPALNGPGCDVPILDPLLAAGCPLVVDNSVLGHALPGALLSGYSSPVLVVESGSKYLSRQASSGVIYGWGEPAAQARLTARRTGQQLQGRALNRLRTGEIAHCADRLALHAEHAKVFREELALRAPRLTVSDAASGLGGRNDLLARHITNGNRGCLLFVILPIAGAEAEQAHRDAVAGWRPPNETRVRAGFGWTDTTAKAYGADPLNSAAGLCFVRLSIGLEPEETIRELATSFAAAAQTVLPEPAVR